MDPEPMTLSREYRRVPRLLADPEELSRELCRVESIIRSGVPSGPPVAGEQESITNSSLVQLPAPVKFDWIHVGE